MVSHADLQTRVPDPKRIPSSACKAGQTDDAVCAELLAHADAGLMSRTLLPAMQAVNVAVYADPASQSPPQCGSNQHAQSFRGQVRCTVWLQRA